MSLPDTVSVKLVESSDTDELTFIEKVLDSVPDLGVPLSEWETQVLMSRLDCEPISTRLLWYKYFVARVDDTLTGMLSYIDQGDNQIVFEDLRVLEEYRGRNIVIPLVAEALRHIEANQPTENLDIIIDVDPRNIKVKRLYQMYGFRVEKITVHQISLVSKFEDLKKRIL